MSETDDKPTPPVPPSETIPIPEHDWDNGTRVIERDRQDTECPRCGARRVDWVVRTTGRGLILSWDSDMFDADEYQLSESVDDTERLNECQECGWRLYA